ncbi:uncharacterized protein LOC111054885 [Nilaparvata lugens]|uniref:uncharacterized protein LOC111054885 n=1 Tax=Nilaparvata lugens TaxID=108931 RepID=UPI00193D2B14|nr:uncharacterized protein LOC111054885 [Nilaparvata lugens]
MNSSVIFALIFILLNEIELSHQAHPAKSQRTKTAQTAPEASSSATVDLFDVLDSDKDEFVTKANLDTFKQGSASSKGGKYDFNEMYETVRDKVTRDQFTKRGSVHYPPVNLQVLNDYKDYDSKALKHVLGIDDTQARKILKGEQKMTAKDVAGFIRDHKFAPVDDQNRQRNMK